MRNLRNVKSQAKVLGWIAAFAVATVGVAPVGALAAQADEAPTDASLDEVPLHRDAAMEDQVENSPHSKAAPFNTTDSNDQVPASDHILSAGGATEGPTVVGVTWAAGSADTVPQIQVRTATAGVWGEWRDLDVDDTEAPDGASPGEVRDGTTPYLAGDVDEVQVAFTGGKTLPTDIRLAVVSDGFEADTSTGSPSASPEDSSGSTGSAPTPTRALGLLAPGAGSSSDLADMAESAAVAETAAVVGTGATIEPAGADAATIDSAVARAATQSEPLAVENVAANTQLLAAAPRPGIHSRAEWDADESLMTWTPQVGQVKAAVIHHTAGTNNYTMDQAPRLIRSIYVYHAVSRGWGDIGYNFLIDKFGRAWEGRAGGVSRAVIGAHAANFNSQTVGISFLGSYDTAKVPDIMIFAATNVIAWKFGIHGVNPAGTVTMNGKAYPKIVGHRDVGQTACPGQYLYGRLPELRTKVAAAMKTVTPVRTSATYTRDLTGDGVPDVLLRSGSTIAIGTSNAGLSARSVAGTGWTARTYSAGDMNKDGIVDLYMIDGSGQLWLYLSAETGGWRPRILTGTGWNGMDLFAAGADWDGDGVPDIIARSTSDKALYFYHGSTARLTSKTRLGTSWGSMTAIAMLGKLDNGQPTLVAADTSGAMYAYRGTGKGVFAGARTYVGGGWQTMSAISGAGDVNGDGKADIVARDSAGRLMLYPGDGQGGLRGKSVLGTGWSVFTTVSAGPRAGVGQDIYARATNGVLYRYPYAGPVNLNKVVPTGISASGVTEVIAAGDWNGDGKPDIMTRRSDGSLYLHPGKGAGSFSTTGTRLGGGWEVMSQVIGVGDWNGDGKPALIALQRSTGQIWLYPGDGKGGFKARVLMVSKIQDVDRVVAGGKWTGSSALDLLTRDSVNGWLQLRKGNGSGGLGGATAIGTGWNALGSVVGVGDFDGDGKPDVIATRGTSYVLYSGNGAGGFYGSRVIGTVPSGYTVS